VFCPNLGGCGDHCNEYQQNGGSKTQCTSYDKWPGSICSCLSVGHSPEVSFYGCLRSSADCAGCSAPTPAAVATTAMSTSRTAEPGRSAPQMTSGLPTCAPARTPGSMTGEPLLGQADGSLASSEKCRCQEKLYREPHLQAIRMSCSHCDIVSKLLCSPSKRTGTPQINECFRGHCVQSLLKFGLSCR